MITKFGGTVLAAAVLMRAASGAFAQYSTIDVTQPPLSTQGNHTQFNDQPGWTHYTGGGSAWTNGGLGWSPVDPMVGTASDTGNKPWAPTGQHINYGHTGQVLESIYSLPGNGVPAGGASITGKFSLWGYNSNQINGGASIMGLGLGNGVNVSIEPVLDTNWNLNQPFMASGPYGDGGSYNGTNWIGDGAYHWMAVLHNNNGENPIALMNLGTFAPAGYANIDQGENTDRTSAGNVFHTATLSLKDNGNNTDDVTVVWDGVTKTLAGVGQLQVYGNNVGALLLNQATFGFGTQEQRDNNNGTFLSYDFIQVNNAVPEPATMGLLAIGSVCLLRRRRLA